MQEMAPPFPNPACTPDQPDDPGIHGLSKTLIATCERLADSITGRPSMTETT